MKKLLITIPCYNEEIVLEKSIFTIVDHAKSHLAEYDWSILIVDNNSSDRTHAIAESLREKYSFILTDQVSDPGRGVAMRVAWERRPGYDIYAYMDADLATDLKDFPFIVSKVSEGYDLVTGSRYVPYADAKRSFNRKLLSKIYNVLLRAVLRVDFRDAQCGFKAMSATLVRELFPETFDSGWFWDTELMILACRKGYRVLEVPVTWREVRDELRASKVSPLAEIIRQLRNIWKMRRRLRQ